MSLSDSSYKKLSLIAGRSNLTRKKEDLLCYSFDSTARVHMPDAVIFPQNTAQVSAILKLARDDNFYVIPRGSGSGATGGTLAVKGGVVIVMSRFNRIIEIDTENLVAHVEPGVITSDLHRAAMEKKLFYPPDPASSAFCSIGGNLAECAGGPGAVKYGVTRDYVLGLEAVLPGGRIIKTGVITAKGVVGYDLTRLIVGSEGTLAVITRVALRLLPLPEAAGTLTAVFETMEAAAETVSGIIREALVPKTIEYMDNAAIRCAENSIKAGLPLNAGALLIIEVDGSENQVKEQMEILRLFCQKSGASEVVTAETPEQRRSLWRARKALSPALFMYAPHKINEDIVVPRSKIPHMVKRIGELKEKSGLMMVSFGHAGDGNIHCNIMLNKDNPEELKKAEAVVEDLFDYTLELGGTISGEHGVGTTKKAYIAKEIGRDELDLMRGIKELFDPYGILNPGKIFPDQQ